MRRRRRPAWRSAPVPWEATDQNLEQYKRFYHLMLEGGVYLPPSPVEAFFLSSAHTDEDIDQTVALAEKSLAAVA